MAAAALPASRHLGRVVAVLVFMVACLTPAAAHAAKPFTLDPSTEAEYPDVAVDAEGTAHVVWQENRPFVSGDPAASADLIHYCPIPRGHRGCQGPLTLSAPADSIGPDTRILIAADGTIYIVTHRCCEFFKSPDSLEATFAFASSDGGHTFGAPVPIGTNEVDGDIVLGPGGFSVSSVSQITTGGVTFQTMPLAGPPVVPQAKIGAFGSLALEGESSLGFVDPLTPVFAGAVIGGHVYVRRFGGGTDYNSATGWGAPIDLGDADDPRFAGLPGGLHGLYLMLRTGPPAKRRYVVRRYTGGTPGLGTDGLRFGAPVQVSEVGDPIFRDFAMDPSGRLHALWIDNSDNSLRHRTSRNGVKWLRTELLLGPDRADNVYNIAADAARDGGGLAVYDVGSGDGPVRAVTFGPQGPVSSGGEGGCVDEVAVGPSVAIAQNGCFKQKGDRFTTSGDVRLNGIDLTTGGGGAGASGGESATTGAGDTATASAGPEIAVDRSARTLTTTAKVEASIGNVQLGNEKLAWRLPNGKDVIRDLAGNPVTLNTAAMKTPLFGLKVSGYTTPQVTGKNAILVPVNVALPAPFDSVLGGGASGSAQLRATNSGGLNLSDFHVLITDAWLGIAELEEFDLSFSGSTSRLTGDTSILLPVAASKLGIAFVLENGDFVSGKGEFTFTAPGQLPVATDVLLKQIRFAVEKAQGCAKPTRIAGGVTFVMGPDPIPNLPLVGLDGDVSYAFPRGSCGLPGVLDASGEGKLVGIPFASLGAVYKTDGSLTFDGNASFSALGAEASVTAKGGVNIPAKQFYASGKASASIGSFELAGFNAVVAGKGIAACGTLTPIPSPGSVIEGDPEPISAGFEYPWGGSFDPDWPPDCDVNLGAYETASASRAGGAHASAANTFTLPKGLPSIEVKLDGQGGVPGFVLSGPHGIVKVFSPAQETSLFAGRIQIVGVPQVQQAFLRILRPPAGTYTVADLAGAAPIKAASVARGLAEPSVKGSVRRAKGRRQELQYRIRRIPGQAVSFVEEGHGVRAPIGLAKRAKGTLRFRPAPGPRGRRTVVAYVLERGIPRARIRVAHFTAPASGLPALVGQVQVRRRGSKAIVTWRRAPGAQRYAVSWRLLDGRRGARIVKHHRFVLSGVPGVDGGTFRVAGLRLDNVAGKVTRVKLRPKPKHLRRGRGRRHHKGGRAQRHHRAH
jgi:hypothetical protein